MAYLKADEILERLRELAESGVGSYRAITSTRFQGGLHDGLTDEEQARLGILDEKPCEVSIVGIRRHPQALTQTGDVNFRLLDIEVRVVRTVSVDGQVDDAIRDDAKALAAADADALAQVFEWPGNLATTEGGESTDLKGMTYVRSRVSLEGEAGAAMRLDTIHTFEGTAVTRPATS